MEHLDISSLEKKFHEHLSDEKNKNVVVSAKFGAGKTYFLKHFFDLHKQEYKPFYVTPLLYQVLKNEDIFKYIEYELLLQIITTQKNGIKLHFSKKNTHKYVDGILQGAAKVLAGVTTIPIDKVYDGFSQIIKAGKKFDESNPATQHLKTIRETFIIEKIIKNEVDRIKRGSGKKTPVLIIDDLDRMYPDHIFRILNIISAYDINGKNEEEVNTSINRLGFKKVIIVCDIDNIQSIYQHNFGKGADFDGYFNKFFSKEIFVIPIEYQRNIFIERKLISEGIIKKIQEKEVIKDNPEFRIYMNLYVSITDLMIQLNIFSIRNLNKYQNKIFIPKEEYIEQIDRKHNKINKQNIHQTHINILYLIKYIIKQSGGDKMFLNNFEKIKELKYEEIKYYLNKAWIFFLLINAIKQFWETDLVVNKPHFEINLPHKLKIIFKTSTEIDYNSIYSSNLSFFDENKDVTSQFSQELKSMLVMIDQLSI